MLLRFFRKTGNVVIGNSFSKIALLAFEFFLAAGAGSENFGLYSIASAFLFVASSLLLFGLSFGIVRYLAIYQNEGREKEIRDLIQWCLIFIATTSSFTGLLFSFGAQMFATSIFNKPELGPILIIVGIIIPFETINQGLGSVFRGLRNYNQDILITDGIRNLVLLLGLPLIWTIDLSATMVFGLILIGSVTGTIFGVIVLVRKIPGLTVVNYADWVILKKLLKFSYLLFIWHMLQVTVTRSSILLAGIFLTNSDVGVLSMYLRLGYLLVFFQSAVNRTIFVEFSSLIHKQSYSQLRYLYENASKALLIVSVVIALPLIVHPYVLLSLFGNEYIEGAWWLLPVIVAQIVEVGTGPIGQLLIAYENQPLILMSSLLGAIMQVSLSIWLMPIYGLAGAVMALATTSVLLTLMRHLFSAQKIGIHFFGGTFFVLLGIGILCGLAGIYTYSLISSEVNTILWILSILVSLIVFSLLMGIYLIFDGSLRRQVHVLYQMILEIIRTNGRMGIISL